MPWNKSWLDKNPKAEPWIESGSSWSPTTLSLSEQRKQCGRTIRFKSKSLELNCFYEHYIRYYRFCLGFLNSLFMVSQTLGSRIFSERVDYFFSNTVTFVPRRHCYFYAQPPSTSLNIILTKLTTPMRITITMALFLGY